KALKWTLLCAAMAGYAAPRQAAAQEPAPAPPAGDAVTQSSHSSAQAEAGEPRADTSASPAPTASAAPEAPTAPQAPAAAKPADSHAQHAPAAARAGASGQKAPAIDRLELGAATVTGDREQPKVMYIVPWKKSDIGDLSGKPMNSLLDEALAPIDRDEFKREVIYYQAVKSDASQNGASRQPAKQGEK
ncbi:MAG TPA: hypothetical protein VJ376_03825, partial [Pseudomonadota bacterium]|nr:hypothetical protein [Pseudomonadota bacterium]